MLKILILLPFHRLTFFVCFDFYNYSLSFTVKLSLSRGWASKEQDCLINHPVSPPPYFDLSATSSYRVLPILLSYLPFISFCELGYCLIKLAKKLLRSVVGSETVSEVPVLAHGLPNLRTDVYLPRSSLDSWGCHVTDCDWL